MPGRDLLTGVAEQVLPAFLLEAGPVREVDVLRGELLADVVVGEVAAPRQEAAGDGEHDGDHGACAHEHGVDRPPTDRDDGRLGADGRLLARRLFGDVLSLFLHGLDGWHHAPPSGDVSGRSGTWLHGAGWARVRHWGQRSRPEETSGPFCPSTGYRASVGEHDARALTSLPPWSSEADVFIALTPQLLSGRRLSEPRTNGGAA